MGVTTEKAQVQDEVRWHESDRGPISHFLRFSIRVEWSDAWSRLGLSTGACLGGSEWGGCQAGFVGHGEGAEPGSGVCLWLGGLG